jgi:cell division protein ZapA
VLLLVLGFSEEGMALSEQEKTRISVDIYGQNYKMVGSESSGHMRLVASIVDDKMREIHSHNGQLDIAKLAVLTAVNTVHDYIKVKEQLELLEEELKRLKD